MITLEEDTRAMIANAYPGAPTTTTACVRARRDLGPNAARLKPSLPDTGGLLTEFSLEDNANILGLPP